MVRVLSLAAGAALWALAPWALGMTTAGDTSPPAPAGIGRVGTAPAGGTAPSTVVEIAVLGYSASRERSTPDEDRRAEIAGRLIHTQVRAHVEQAPVSEVLKAFGRAVGVPMLPLYRAQAGDPGLDPSERIDLDIESESAHVVLEAIMAAALGGSGTWQIHGERVEVGPRWLLARDGAREAVTLPIRDLLLEPPTVQKFGADVRAALQERFPEAVLVQGRGDRSTPDVIAAELVIEIERKVEPEAWLVDETQRASLVRSGEIDNPLARAGQWASMTARDGTLMVTAPDFVLRGIRGYPGALPPLVEPIPRATTRVVAPEQPVVSALGGGRMELLGFMPAEGSRRRQAETSSITQQAIDSAGRLVHARLNVVLEDTSVRDAMEMLVRTTGAGITPHWASESAPGIDPSSRLTLEMHDASGRQVLEILLAMSNASSECTWQLAGGGIEVGPKSLLARPAVRRSVTLDVSDLLIEAPYFISPGFAARGDGMRSLVTPLERRYGEELGMNRDMRPGGEVRKSQAFLAAELLLLLEKHVEPKGWIPSDDQMLKRADRGLREFEPLQRDGAWVGATYRAGTLSVKAPDFVLRQLVGYPYLPSPAGGG